MPKNGFEIEISASYVYKQTSLLWSNKDSFIYLDKDLFKTVKISG